MEQKNPREFDQNVYDLFDKFVHGDIDRRTFVDQAGKFGIAGMTGAMILDALTPRFAEAEVVPKDDKRIIGEYVEYPSPQGNIKMRGYLVRPAGKKGKLAGVLVVHENRGLNPHIEDIARRVALEGFMAFAPDALFPLGGYPGDEDKAREVFPKLDQAKTREDFVAAAGWLKSRPDCTGKVAVVGFCYGGGIANMLATRIPDLAGAVPFYGGAPPADDVKNIKCPILVHHAEKDERLVAGWPAYEAALKANNVKYEGFVYPGAQHGFNNDTTPRFDKANADLAWKRTIEFFQKNLK
ncbi:MAG: dienelactone hydrolase family protein [Vicinamibacteria bacterium]|nr:dienelactone hydrolase family protein [Vicinamibacteria bacterium]